MSTLLFILAWLLLSRLLLCVFNTEPPA